MKPHLLVVTCQLAMDTWAITQSFLSEEHLWEVCQTFNSRSWLEAFVGEVYPELTFDPSDGDHVVRRLLVARFSGVPVLGEVVALAHWEETTRRCCGHQDSVNPLWSRIRVPEVPHCRLSAKWLIKMYDLLTWQGGGYYIPARLPPQTQCLVDCAKMLHAVLLEFKLKQSMGENGGGLNIYSSALKVQKVASGSQALLALSLLAGALYHTDAATRHLSGSALPSLVDFARFPLEPFADIFWWTARYGSRTKQVWSTLLHLVDKGISSGTLCKTWHKAEKI